MRRIQFIGPHDRGISLKVQPPARAADYHLVFTWNELEEQNGAMPAEAEHNRKVGTIMIDRSDADGFFRGRHESTIHPARNVSITNSDHGIAFDVVCLNRNPFFVNNVFWSSYMSRKDFKSLSISALPAKLLVQGECLADMRRVTAEIGLNQTGGIEYVVFPFEEDHFHAFHKRLNEAVVL